MSSPTMRFSHVGTAPLADGGRLALVVGEASLRFAALDAAGVLALAQHWVWAEVADVASMLPNLAWGGISMCVEAPIYTPVPIAFFDEASAAAYLPEKYPGTEIKYSVYPDAGFALIYALPQSALTILKLFPNAQLAHVAGRQLAQTASIQTGGVVSLHIAPAGGEAGHLYTLAKRDGTLQFAAAHPYADEAGLLHATRQAAFTAGALPGIDTIIISGDIALATPRHKALEQALGQLTLATAPDLQLPDYVEQAPWALLMENGK